MYLRFFASLPSEGILFFFLCSTLRCQKAFTSSPFLFDACSSFPCSIAGQNTMQILCLNCNTFLQYLLYSSCLLVLCTSDGFSSLHFGRVRSAFLGHQNKQRCIWSIVLLCKSLLNAADPNRPGMHMKLIKFLLKLKAPRIVYVSCNPATCARDLDYLCHGDVCVNF